MAERDPYEFRHDLIIASENGTVYHLKREQWEHEDNEAKDYESNCWDLVRELLECGVNLATVPPKAFLPPDKVEPRGTCYLVNLESLKQTHKYLRKPQP